MHRATIFKEHLESEEKEKEFNKEKKARLTFILQLNLAEI